MTKSSARRRPTSPAQRLDWRSRVADRIRSLLRAKGLSEQDLTGRVTLPAQQVEAILAARAVRVRARDLDLIAAALGTAAYALFLPIEAPIEVVPLEIVEQSGSGHAK
jgi:transcriptional regulator with XRE-family HTH domain